MASWVEITTQPAATYSNLAGFAGTRVFKLWGGVVRESLLNSPEQVIDSTTGIPLPAYDSDWPLSGEWSTPPTLERYEATIVSGDIIIATAYYSDRRRRVEYESSFQTESEEIKYSFRVPIILPVLTVAGSYVPVNPGEQSSNFINFLQLSKARTWIEDSFVQFSTWYRISRSYYIKEQSPYVTSELNVPISRQVNKIHNIGSVTGPSVPGGPINPLYARFEGADINQLAWDRYRVTYSWVVDSGIQSKPFSELIRTALGDTPYSESEFIIPKFESRLYGSGTGTDQNWFRPPFERIKSMPNDIIADPQNLIPPRYYCIIPYEVDPEGWRTLPTS